MAKNRHSTTCIHDNGVVEDMRNCIWAKHLDRKKGSSCLPVRTKHLHIICAVCAKLFLRTCLSISVCVELRFMPEFLLRCARACAADDVLYIRTPYVLVVWRLFLSFSKGFTLGIFGAGD